MKKKCSQCKLVNYPTAAECGRCGSVLVITEEPSPSSLPRRVLNRIAFFVLVCGLAIVGFYGSLVFSSQPLNYDQKQTVSAATELLRSRGFSTEAFLLSRAATFRSTDHWLNSSVVKENAFAAANFPFAIITLYPDFFTYPADEVEKAAILLHEAKHLQGADEKEAYEFVWRNREKLGWTSEKYAESVVWKEIRKQTRDIVPEIFVCDINPAGDCTENRVSKY